jgi:hypothetical protein
LELEHGLGGSTQKKSLEKIFGNPLNPCSILNYRHPELIDGLLAWGFGIWNLFFGFLFSYVIKSTSATSFVL